MPGRGVTITPEFELLSACSAWPVSMATKIRVAEAFSRPGLNWDQFVALTERHRVTALAHNALKQNSASSNEAIMAPLQRLARQEALKELTLAGELVRISKAIQAAGIEVILLKGVSIALLGFKRLGLRTNRDIDILVDTSQLEDCDRVLTGIGYTRLEPAGPLSPAALKQWTTLHKDMVYRSREADAIVEVHWRLFDNPHLLPKLDVGPMPRLAYGGGQLQVLPTSLNVIYLCLHGMQHAWSRMKWLADLGAVLSTLSQIEIAQVYEEASKLGLRAPVGASLALCSEVLASPIPASITDAARRGWRERMLRAVAMSSLTTGGAVEMEDRNFGSTWKNVSHYIFRFDLPYLGSELKYDLMDDPADPTQGRLSQLLLRIPRWIIRQSHRGAKTSRRMR